MRVLLKEAPCLWQSDSVQPAVHVLGVCVSLAYMFSLATG